MYSLQTRSDSDHVPSARTMPRVRGRAIGSSSRTRHAISRDIQSFAVDAVQFRTAANVVRYVIDRVVVNVAAVTAVTALQGCHQRGPQQHQMRTPHHIAPLPFTIPEFSLADRLSRSVTWGSASEIRRGIATGAQRSGSFCWKYVSPAVDCGNLHLARPGSFRQCCRKQDVRSESKLSGQRNI